MSKPLFQDDVEFLQRFLKCAELYTGRIDGLWGLKTDTAVMAFEAETVRIAQRFEPFDPTSERAIRTLIPQAQVAARRFLDRLRTAEIPARIISGTRTYAEQNQLYRQGRYGNSGLKVTNARGGQSNHNFGIAWDIGIFQQGAYLGESPWYHQAAEIGLEADLEWGGHWTAFVDRPHYQLAIGQPIRVVRQHFEAGTAFV
jgi:peptidoglycan LD-endopeptidase CwlK